MQYCHFTRLQTTPVTILHNNPPAVAQSLLQISIHLMKPAPLSLSLTLSCSLSRSLNLLPLPDFSKQTEKGRNGDAGTGKQSKEEVEGE